jgi:glucan 1,3-beta-glucosidase
MRFFVHLAVFSCAASQVTATHGGRNDIPEIETDVQSMTLQFAPAVTYAGPTDAKASHYPTSSPTATPTPASYWLADIKHQGIAAFNPDPNYQVFRNVKDFGAKGELNDERMVQFLIF